MERIASDIGPPGAVGSSLGSRNGDAAGEAARTLKEAPRDADRATGRPSSGRARELRSGWKRVLGRLTLLAFVVLVSLFALELMTRVVYDRNGMHFGIEMWKYAKKIKRTSSNPAMGHEHTPGTAAFLMGVPVQINSAGMRDREFSPAKPTGVYRILVLGDSITFGWGVPQDKTFSKRLESKLNENPPRGGPERFEVINTGVGNYNTAQEVAYFKERGRLYKPDMVLIAFFINDAEPTPREETNWVARQSCLYVFASAFWDGVLRQIGWRPPYREYYLSLYQEGGPGWVACRQAFRELIAACKEDHIELRIAIVPELHSQGKDYEFPQVHDAIRAIAKEGGVPVIDLLDSISVEDLPALWVSPGDPHPNERAQEMFASQLYKTLEIRSPGQDIEPSKPAHHASEP
jgi:lysophospholipase L1-like esterase